MQHQVLLNKICGAIRKKEATTGNDIYQTDWKKNNHGMPDIWEKNFLFNKRNIQGNKAFHFQYKRRLCTSPTFQVKGHEEEAPPACRTCSCQALEYSKELRVQRFQSRPQILGKPACTRRTCHPPGKVSASHVDHSRHNTVGQFFQSQAIPVRRAERHVESTGLERHVPPPSTSYDTWLGDRR